MQRLWLNAPIMRKLRYVGRLAKGELSLSYVLLVFRLKSSTDEIFKSQSIVLLMYLRWITTRFV